MLCRTLGLPDRQFRTNGNPALMPDYRTHSRYIREIGKGWDVMPDYGFPDRQFRTNGNPALMPDYRTHSRYRREIGKGWDVMLDSRIGILGQMGTLH